ncbi:cytochrome c biogenesis CcdA family protein [Lysobacter sp. S4-A87]|uniref:cytochrome c biogenesis CcdA family protein n=1 Tax=Lysobacter sp. S4-A87 TaxID=2925843 RepID=UPI001F533954|nr:cytochrome c biogenesis CcdA family protein [Lysobacter sp. S4-A87]UNK49800.1 cytochrome c biogenesis CcdA family protein [Lysobacter sp. S4-A87]
MFAHAVGLEFALAGAAGIATILSPCILPVLPIVLATSTGRSRFEPALIIAGFVATFAASGILIGALSSSSGELQQVIRTGSIWLLLIAGLACLWPAPFNWLVARVQQWRSPRTDASRPRPHRSGSVAALLVGASLGLAWTPCAGPILASVLSLAASSQAPGKAASLLAVYAVGAGLPMLAIAYGGHWITSRLAFLNRRAELIRRVFGAIAIAVATLQLFQYDVLFSAWATQWLPSVSTGL